MSAITRLNRSLDHSVGRAAYHGQKVYGARRIIAERRAAVIEMLKAETGVAVAPETPRIVTHEVSISWGRIACFGVTAAALAALMLFRIEPGSLAGILIMGAGSVTLAAGLEAI